MPIENTSNTTDGVSTHKSRGKRKKCSWGEFICYTIILTLGLYVASLITLNTTWAKSKITDQLKIETGLEWNCGRILWVPFSDITIHDLQSDLGAGGVEVKTIVVVPVWAELIKGRLNWGDISLDEVTLDLDELWLEEYLKEQKLPTEPIRSSVVQQIPPLPITKRKPDSTLNKKTPPVVVQQTKPSKQINKTLPLKDKPVELAKWVNIQNVNLIIRRGELVLKEQKGIQVSIPHSGPEAEGFLRFGVKDLLTNSLGQKNVPILWKDGRLAVNNGCFDLLGIKFNVDAVLLVRHPAKLFTVQINVLDQSFSLKSPIPNFDISIDAQHLRSEFIMNGSLNNSQSWLGQGRVSAENVNIVENQKTHSKLEFDYTGMTFRYLGGSLVIERAEASSHQLIILMNGVVQKNLYSYGTMRIIGTEDMANKLNRIHHGAKALHLDHKRAVILEPLDNPDRHFCDLKFYGELTDLQLKHNRSDHWQSLNKALNSLERFKDKELEEDGLLILE